MPPLDGIRIVDCSTDAGAYCAKLLADLGAEVVKLEPPGGSPEREAPLSFLHFHRRSRSVTVDLASAEGRSRLERLIAGADALLKDRSMLLPLDDAEIRALNPTLARASISGFGSHGPRAAWKSSDLVAQATGGLMYRMGFPEDPPNSMGEGFAYHQTSAHAAAGVLMALVHRDATGAGQNVDLSMQEGIALMQYDAMPMYVSRQALIKRAGHGQGSSGKRYRRIWTCKSGLVRFQLVSQSSDREWPLLLDWLESRGFGDGLRDERWTPPEARLAGLGELEEAFDRFFRTLDSRTLMHEAQDRGIMLMAFNSVGELLSDPQLAGEGFFRTVGPVESSSRDGGADLVDAGPPYRFAGGLGEGRGARPPAPGEHNPAPFSDRPRAASAVPASASPPPSGKAPLAGLRVVDFTWVIAGPLHTKWLAAYGAEVIKIERFKKGAALNRGNMSPDSVISFNNLNAGKRSLAIDMSFEESRQAVAHLVAKSDIVVDNFGPDVLPNWGFTPARLQEINPRIITLSMPALGKTGPHRLYKGLGSYFQARAGLDGLIGYPHRDITDVGFAYADTTCNASHAMIALLAALRQRNVSGKGEHIELRQLESSINFLGPALLEWSDSGVEPVRRGSRSARHAPQGVYPCAGDDEWCALTVFSNDEWAALCRLIGRPEWAADPALAAAGSRMARHDEIDAAIEAWTRRRSPDSAAQELQDAGVPAGAVLNAGAVIDHDPQMAARGFYRRFPGSPEASGSELDAASPVVVEAAPFLLSDAPQHIDPRLHDLGEDTTYVLSDILGMDAGEVARMFESGAVGGA